MNLRARMTGTALVLTLATFGLAACGSDDEGDTKTDETSQTDSTDSADDSSSEGTDGKPSKDEVVDGYTKLVTDLAGGQELPEDIVKKVVTCFVDEVYDEASPGTLKAIAGGDQTGVDPDDASLFTEATSTCQQAAMQ